MLNCAGEALPLAVIAVASPGARAQLTKNTRGHHDAGSHEDNS